MRDLTDIPGTLAAAALFGRKAIETKGKKHKMATAVYTARQGLQSIVDWYHEAQTAKESWAKIIFAPHPSASAMVEYPVRGDAWRVTEDAVSVHIRMERNDNVQIATYYISVDDGTDYRLNGSQTNISETQATLFYFLGTVQHRSCERYKRAIMFPYLQSAAHTHRKSR